MKNSETTQPAKPWHRPEWREQVVRWMEGELTRSGCTATMRIEQVRSSDDGIVLRVQAAEDVFYFKALADSPWVANEPVVADALGTLYPHVVPKPLSIDGRERWMLTDVLAPRWRMRSAT